MNERIDELIEQCTVQNFSDCVGGYETFDKEKFAELLLTDFINALHESNFYSSETTENSLNIIIKGAKTFLELKNERN